MGRWGWNIPIRCRCFEGEVYRVPQACLWDASEGLGGTEGRRGVPGVRVGAFSPQFVYKVPNTIGESAHPTELFANGFIRNVVRTSKGEASLAPHPAELVQDAADGAVRRHGGIDAVGREEEERPTSHTVTDSRGERDR